MDHTTLQTKLANKLELIFSDPRVYNTIDTIEKQITQSYKPLLTILHIRTIAITHKMKPLVTPAILNTMK